MIIIQTPDSTDYIIMIFMGTLFNLSGDNFIIVKSLVAIGSGSKNNHYASPFVYITTKHISAC